MLTVHSLIYIADKKQGVEFYDFLHVNTESGETSEVTDNCKRDDEDVEQEQASGVPFIDFFSVGSQT